MKRNLSRTNLRYRILKDVFFSLTILMEANFANFLTDLFKSWIEYTETNSLHLKQKIILRMHINEYSALRICQAPNMYYSKNWVFFCIFFIVSEKVMKIWVVYKWPTWDALIKSQSKKNLPFPYTLFWDYFLQQEKGTIKIMPTNLKLTRNIKNNDMIPYIIIIKKE